MDGRANSRSRSDYVLGNDCAIEVKHTDHVSERDLKGLLAISGEKKWKHKIVVSRDPVRRRIEDIEILPVQEFLADLWQGRFA